MVCGEVEMIVEFVVGGVGVVFVFEVIVGFGCCGVVFCEFVGDVVCVCILFMFVWCKDELLCVFGVFFDVVKDVLWYVERLK